MRFRQGGLTPPAVYARASDLRIESRVPSKGLKRPQKLPLPARDNNPHDEPSASRPKFGASASSRVHPWNIRLAAEFLPGTPLPPIQTNSGKERPDRSAASELQS